jgi:hypothetical protein
MAVGVVLRDVHAFSTSALSIVWIVVVHQVLVSGSLTCTRQRLMCLEFSTLLFVLLLLELLLVLLDLAVEEVVVALGEEVRA